MKKDYFFNTLAGIINASEAIIISIIITRTASLTDAGYITIAFAIGNLLLSIGKYGIYGFQVTEHSNKYTFADFLNVRIITTLTMVLSLILYDIYGTYVFSYNREKSLIVLLIGLIYSIESFEDLIKAQLHYLGCLYLGALFFILRWLSILISFGMSMYCIGNVTTSLAISFIVSLFVFSFCCFYVRKTIYIKADYNRKHIVGLLSSCFPIFLSTFLSFYTINSSKYAIDRCMDAKVQACYGFVAMPIFAIDLLSCFIYQPQLRNLTLDYLNNEIKHFRLKMVKQYSVILFFTITGYIFAYFLGIPILSLLYHTNLNNYLYELLVLILSGGFLALTGYQSMILTIMRKQIYQLIGYIPISILAFLFVSPIVKKYGTVGAAFSCLLLFIFLFIIYEIFICKELKGKK